MRSHAHDARQVFAARDIGHEIQPSRGAPSIMPTVSVFYGIVIRMYRADHAPPHFHAEYGEHEAVVDISTGELIAGWLPRRARALILQWVKVHGQELMENWRACETNRPLKTIAPLD